MRVLPRKLVCCVLIAGICLASTGCPSEPSPTSSTPGSAAVPTSKELVSKSPPVAGVNHTLPVVVSTPKEFVSKATGIKLALIPAGTFLMGASPADVKAGLQADKKDEEPQHTVKISWPFYMGVYEVTQAEYESVMGTNPSSFSKTGRDKSAVSGLDTSKFPVEMV